MAAEMTIGPDAWRYLALGRGEKVVRPFHLRWLLPKLCGEHVTRWRAVWLASWLVAAFGTWAVLGGTRGVVAAVLLLALPGVLGPESARPVTVDLPAMSLGVCSWAALEHGLWPVAVVLVLVAATIKESSPVWVALWSWNLLPLVGLVAVGIRAVVSRPGMDALTARNKVLRQVHERPFGTAWESHREVWRDAWVMVAPWGVCLAALYDAPPQLLAVVVVAHLQLLIATDTVRLTHTAAGPALAVAAASVIPEPWLILALAVHVAWWRRPEFV